MTKRKRVLGWSLGLGLLGLGGLGAAATCDADTETVTGAKHLEHQIWIERMPDDARDMIGQVVFTRHQNERVGVMGKASRYRMFLEVFTWALEVDRLHLFFPQSEGKATLQVRTWECRGEAPKPFELCLELTANHRTIRYYSRHDWVVDPQDEDALPADLPAAASKLPRVLPEDAGGIAPLRDAATLDVLAKLQASGG